MSSLFSDYLGQLGVRHTDEYSDKRFRTMPFQTLFGLSKLLGEYGVASMGVKARDKSAIGRLPLPFLADTADGIVIVTGIGADKVSYLSQGHAEQADEHQFLRAWNGIALISRPAADACEPDYGKHRAVEVMDSVKVWALRVLSACLVAFALIITGLWHRWSSYALLALDLAGIWVSYMLVQKSLNIKHAKADAVCSVLQEGGCDSIAKSQAASFMGIVKWSEVGLGYFTVSLLALLLFPDVSGPYLALLNACCLPYTVWSITYQKFVAKTWCTLCVTVQALLWALFACYLLGGWWDGAFPLRWPVAVLAACYITAVLAINAFDRGLSRLLHLNTNDNGNADTADRL